MQRLQNCEVTAACFRAARLGYSRSPWRARIVASLGERYKLYHVTRARDDLSADIVEVATTENRSDALRARPRISIVMTSGSLVAIHHIPVRIFI